MLAFLLLVLGISSRLIVHVPNFTPVIAVALFSGVYLKKRQALWIPVLLMAISDVFIGFHSSLIFTWSSMLIIAGMGLRLREQKSIRNIVVYSLGAAVLFFIITNFGSWLRLYPYTFSGLVSCYVAAIPFFRHTLVSTLLYALLLFGAYELIALRVRGTRLAHIVS